MRFRMVSCRSIVHLRILIFILICGAKGLSRLSAQAAPGRPVPTPAQLAMQAATEAEHQREMDLLGI